MQDRNLRYVIAAIALAGCLLWIGPRPAAAALPADLAIEIQRAATNYHNRLRQAERRRSRGMNRTLAAAIERNDQRVAEAALTAAVSRGITRNSALTEELVGAAVAAAPALRPGLVQRLGSAYPGFRQRIRQASVAPPRPPPLPPATSAKVRTAPVRAAPPPPIRPSSPAPVRATARAPVETSPARIVLRAPKPRTARARQASLARARPAGLAPLPEPSRIPATQGARFDELDELDDLDDEELDASQIAAAQALTGDPSSKPGRATADVDPLEGFNRAVFAVNDTLDQYLLRPITWVYRLILPRLVRRSLHNAFRNLGAPVILANDVLQAEAEDAGVTFSRFIINRTLGIVGLFDVATEFGLEYHPADFGETLNTYDVGTGPYLVLPILGPGSVRHGAGRIVDGFLNPLNYLVDRPVRGGLLFAEIVTVRDNVFTQLDSLRKTSIDYYAAIRSLYYQDRAGMLRRRSDGLESPPVLLPALE